MSLSQRVKQGFLRMPLRKKALLVASGALMLSVVMPWYDERNSFGIGESFMGVQGPLFAIGFLTLAFGTVSFLALFLPLMGRPSLRLRKKDGLLSLVLGVQSLLLLAVANTVFYHPDFGINLSNKSTRFGMTVAFFSVAVMIVAGWFSRHEDAAAVVEEVDDLEASPSVASSEPVYTPMPQQTSFSHPVNPGPATPPSSDPLSMDARTRYKLMQSRMRADGITQGNLWGGGANSAYSQRASNSYHAEPRNIPVDRD